jgi:hypothetical protein
MAKSTINLGTTPNDRTGDTLRDTGTKVNSNFNELYTALGNGTTLNIASSGATTGQVLKFNGTNFAPATDLNTDAVSSVNTKTGAVVLVTDDIAEDGTPVNLWFTNARARGAVSAGTGIGYSSSTGVISLSATSDNLTEGTTNLFYTSTRFNNSLGTKTTDDLAEGTVNKYFVATSPAFTTSITTSSTSFDLINTTAATVNFAKAATTLSIGATTGTTTVNNDFNLPTGKVYEINDTSVLSATTLGSGVTGSSLTSVGTIATGVWNGTAITAAYGGTGLTSLGTGVATFLGTPSSANLLAAITNETGTGALVFGTSPAITTSITTASTTFSLINTTATTVNFAGAATVALNIGSSNAPITGFAKTATTSSTAESLGYLGTPINTQSANYTTVIGDAGKTIYVTDSGTTITIPANATVAYPIGTRIEVITGPAGSFTTIALTTDTFVGKGGGSGPASLGGYGHAILTKVAATTWFCSVL